MSNHIVKGLIHAIIHSVPSYLHRDKRIISNYLRLFVLNDSSFYSVFFSSFRTSIAAGMFTNTGDCLLESAYPRQNKRIIDIKIGHKRKLLRSWKTLV